MNKKGKESTLSKKLDLAGWLGSFVLFFLRCAILYREREKYDVTITVPRWPSQDKNWNRPRATDNKWVYLLQYCPSKSLSSFRRFSKTLLRFTPTHVVQNCEKERFCLSISERLNVRDRTYDKTYILVTEMWETEYTMIRYIHPGLEKCGRQNTGL